MPRPERSASSAPIASGFLAHSNASPSSSNTRTLSLAYFSFSCAGTPVSVSYTHLDVYKRQGYARADDALRTKKRKSLEELVTWL